MLNKYIVTVKSKWLNYFIMEYLYYIVVIIIIAFIIFLILNSFF